MLLLIAAVLTACNRGSNDQTAYMKSAIVTPIPPPPSPWPSFVAQDYRSLHKQRLLPGEVSSIRNTLTLVKPCQRQFLRFAFSQNGGFVLFFDLSNSIWPHVLWTDNTYYKKLEGTVFKVPDHGTGRNAGIEWDVKTTGCNGQVITK